MDLHERTLDAPGAPAAAAHGPGGGGGRARGLRARRPAGGRAASDAAPLKARARAPIEETNTRYV